MGNNDKMNDVSQNWGFNQELYFNLIYESKNYILRFITEGYNA